MSALIRWTLPLVAYLCVGTVASALLGYAYLRNSGRLDDDTMFRIMALLHGVDLDEIARQGQATAEEIPAEEPSFAQQQQHIQAATLHFDAKQKQLEASLTDFDYQLKRVNEATQRYSQLRSNVETYLKGQQEALSNSDVANVRAQLELLIPKKQAKPLLIEHIKSGNLDMVILLLGSMKERNRREILRTFDTPDDIQMLFQIEQHMLNDNPAKDLIREQLEALKQLEAQEK